MWLQAVVLEPGDEPGDPPKMSRPKQGTPQGGVISPLLANLYLHWFDKMFHSSDGPFQWANARLIRYADDFVIMTKYIGGRIQDFVHATLEEWLGLKINRDKTRILNLANQQESLDFLGYTFRYDRDRHGRQQRYLNMCPSKKALQRERQKLRGMTEARMCFKPIPEMIRGLNNHLVAWSRYFSIGYHRHAFRQINRYVRERLIKHLQRRSQRPYRPPKGRTWYAHLKQLGLVYL